MKQSLKLTFTFDPKEGEEMPTEGLREIEQGLKESPDLLFSLLEKNNWDVSAEFVPVL